MDQKGLQDAYETMCSGAHFELYCLHLYSSFPVVDY
jgi:hypothetical protein